MIYVEMLGRMGNQMFSYAHARYIQEIFPTEKIAIDFSNFRQEDETWINYLQYFECAKNIEIQKREMHIIQRAVLRLYYKAHSNWGGYSDAYVKERKWAKFLSFFDLYIFKNGYFPFCYSGHFKNKLLIGFFESDKYFLPIREILLKEFYINNFLNNKSVSSLVDTIRKEAAICVGVRKGDFVSLYNQAYCDICSPRFYARGVDYLLEHTEELQRNKDDLKIFVFTDDISWVKENLAFHREVIYVTSSVNGDIKPWEMLQIMTYFRYYIIPNSSFFWWGQFLSQELNRVVIAPSVWRSRDQEIYQDIYESNWILLPPDGGDTTG